MASEFFSEDQNLAELVSHMPPDDQRRFNKYGHFRVEAAFKDRVLIVYRPTGLTPAGQHREPDILTTVRVIDFSVDLREGCKMTLRDQQFDQEMVVGHVPKRLFGYPIYVAVPPRTILRWDVREVDGRAWRSMSFAMLIKTRNRSSFYSKGNVYAETPGSSRPCIRMSPAGSSSEHVKIYLLAS